MDSGGFEVALIWLWSFVLSCLVFFRCSPFVRFEWSLLRRTKERKREEDLDASPSPLPSLTEGNQAGCLFFPFALSIRFLASASHFFSR